jgi:hypothetical protein
MREYLNQEYITQSLNDTERLIYDNINKSKFYDIALATTVLNPIVLKHLYSPDLKDVNLPVSPYNPDQLMEYIKKIKDPTFLQLTNLVDINKPTKASAPLAPTTTNPVVLERPKFTYFNNMFEGIYINENIMGLTRTLIKIIQSTKNIELENIKKQKNKPFITEILNKFETEEFNIRNSKWKELEEEKQEIIMINNTERYINKNNLALFNSYNLDKEKIYNSQKMFLDDENIIIDPIIRKYNNEQQFKITDDEDPTQFKLIPIKKVDSYKLFYLVTNDDQDKKCFHQYELLENTLSLINAIRN